MHRHGELQARIDALCDRAREAHADQALLVEMEYVLSEGYACALAAEAEIVRLGRRVKELIDHLDERQAPAIRRLGAERRALEQSAARLRARLAVMQSRFADLGRRSRPQTSSSVSP
jgi:hypothetical protein